jgi:hypothetical protein
VKENAMKTYQGYLRELGQAEVNSRNKSVEYTYVEIGDQMIKKLTSFSGLDSKLNNALGKTVSLHVNGNYLVALTTEDGQTYCTEKFGLLPWLATLICVVMGALFSVVIIGLPFLLAGLQSLNVMLKAKSGAELPKAVEIPR